eukprot:5556118-Pyramimonas_sp.AAC.1
MQSVAEASSAQPCGPMHAGPTDLCRRALHCRFLSPRPSSPPSGQSWSAPRRGLAADGPSR